MFFELVSILFAIVPDYSNDYMTKQNNNWTSFKNFAPKLNLNHNINNVHHFDHLKNILTVMCLPELAHGASLLSTAEHF